MDDDQIYSRGGTERDVEEYANANGADLTNADIAEAAKFTPQELELINNTAERFLANDTRPIVVMALASHLIGIVIRGSEGTLSKQLVVDLVAKGVEE